MSKAVTKKQLADCLERIGDYFIQTNEDFTGASDSVAGAKGMVPAPSAGDDVKFLRGDGTWAEPAGGGGGGSQGGSGECGVRLADVTGVGYEALPGRVNITWTDPDDVSYQGASLARWAGTKLLRKVGSAPADETDGTVVVNSTTKNAYSSTAYADTSVENGTTYYYRLFPYTDVGSHTASSSFNATPNLYTTTLTVTKTGDAAGAVGTVCEVATVSTNGDGQLTATSSDDTIGTVSISNGKVYVTIVDYGTITVTVSQSASTNYSSAGPETFSVDLANIILDPVLNNNTPEAIQYAAQNDLAASLWDIGDYFEMTLNGNWQCVDNTITLNNYVIRCVLIGINHNADKEGNHLLHFQMGKNTDNVDIAFHYSKMNTDDTNSGGWKSCKMRTITMANLYSTIIPANWRAVIATTIKYTDNTGGGSDTASYVTATEDKCFLLAEYELHGARTYANSAEQTKQKQYAYYANGNSKVRYRNDSPTSAYGWWLRGAHYGRSKYFCVVNSDGSAYFTDAYNNCCVGPCFSIG